MWNDIDLINAAEDNSDEVVIWTFSSDDYEEVDEFIMNVCKKPVEFFDGSKESDYIIIKEDAEISSGYSRIQMADSDIFEELSTQYIIKFITVTGLLGALSK